MIYDEIKEKKTHFSSNFQTIFFPGLVYIILVRRVRKWRVSIIESIFGLSTDFEKKNSNRAQKFGHISHSS